jgi:ElaB/YqjD/DUF883 family membrane-anchored ribosome-binding protein
MEAEKNVYDFGNPESGDIGSTARDIKEQGKEAYQQAREKGTELYKKAEDVAKDRYKKTAEAVGDTYGKAIKYGQENPDKAFFIGVAVGVALGILFGGGFGISRSRHSD